MAALHVIEEERVEPRTARHVRLRRVRWVWRDILPAGMLSVIAGAPGSSKSLLASFIVAEVSRHHECVVSNVEDPEEEVTAPRLVAAGANMENVTLWPARLVDGFDVAELCSLVRTMQVKLLVLDPLTAHVPPTRQALLPLARAARKAGTAILGLHHTTKRGGNYETALERIAGPTGGAIGTARALYAFGPHPDAPETERALAAVKVNVSAPPRSLAFQLDTRPIEVEGKTERVPTLRLTDTSSPTTADEILRGARDDFDSGVVAAAAEWLTTYLRLGPRPVEEVYEDGAQLGLTPHALRRSADVVGTLTDRHEELGVLWRLPERHPFARSS